MVKQRPFMQRLLGWLIVVGGIAALLNQAWRGWADQADPRVMHALLGGGMAALATALGTVPVLVSRTIPARVHDSLLGFGAGVMLAACSFSLIVPGLEAARAQGAGTWGSALMIGGGIALGAALMMSLEHWLPHEHFIKGVEGTHAQAIKRTWLFVFAIALHNVPEGLAIGVAFGNQDPVGASALATGISIQDVPEGLVVSLALLGIGYSRATAVVLGAASGLVEPLGAVLGASVVTVSTALLPWGLAFAAGAMLFVISHEIIPESHRKGHERFATSGLIAGFVLMMVLDTALG
ncbi:MAG TPA: ZIP family metal transporter [Candidatus Aquabacterium excrementipullorum]|nr:ZIP family metal transporter [Candidatus Aquabacterium excrementipullorum]